MAMSNPEISAERLRPSIPAKVAGEVAMRTEASYTSPDEHADTPEPQRQTLAESIGKIAENERRARQETRNIIL